MATPVQAHLIPAHLLPKVSHQQLQALQRCFKENRNPSDLELGIIAAEVGLDEHDVRAWFNHRLACWRQEQGLPANSGSVMD